MTTPEASLKALLDKEVLLEDSERQLRALADAIPLIVWTAKPNGEVDYYNRQWELYTGLSTEQTYGWGWAPVIHPDDLQACIDRWTQAFMSGEPYETEYRFKRGSDGSYRWHLGRAIPFRNEAGEITKWLGTGTDIDDQIRAKEQLQQAFLDIEKVVKERTAELASVNQMLLRQNEIRKSAVETLQQDSIRLNEIIKTQYLLAKAALDHEAFIALVIERMALLTHANGVVFEMIEDGEMVYRATTGTLTPYLGMRLEMQHSLSGLCVQSREVLHCNDTETDPRVNLDACRKVNARSMVVAPLFNAGSPIGVLKIMAAEPHAFNERDTQTLQLMAGLLGAAIGHQLDYETNRRLLEGRTEALDALKREIEHRSKVEEAIKDNEWRTRMIIESSYDAFIAINAQGVVTSWNQQAEVIFGWSRQEAIGAVLGDLIIPEPYRASHRAGMQRFLVTGEGAVLNKPIELVGLRRGGEEFPVELTIRALEYHDGVEFCAFLRDITERKKTEQKLLQYSLADALTDLPNRSMFDDRLAEAIKRTQRANAPMALLYLDIDRLNTINDTYGHQVGDGLLLAAAHRMREAIRDTDTLARVGGDEFAIIVEGLTHPADAETLAAKIIDNMRQPLRIDQLTLNVTTSVGIAYYEAGLSPDQLVQLADQAMYRAKKAGRNRLA